MAKLDRLVRNTRQELAAHFTHAQARGWRRVIIVTSPSHTRRVRLIWNGGYQAEVAALVHPTPYERFEPDRWWRSTRSLETGLYELAAIANFLIGSPVPTYGRAEQGRRVTSRAIRKGPGSGGRPMISSRRATSGRRAMEIVTKFALR